MIVQNKGYLDLEGVLRLKSQFSIYETHKGTQVLVQGATGENINLYYPKEDRLPWKLIEGKGIVHGKKVFDSSVNKLVDLDTSKWNNGNQIMTYCEYSVL